MRGPVTDDDKWAMLEEAGHLWGDDAVKELAYQLGLTSTLLGPDDPPPQRTIH